MTGLATPPRSASLVGTPILSGYVDAANIAAHPARRHP
jgi:hypothetical protein